MSGPWYGRSEPALLLACLLAAGAWAQAPGAEGAAEGATGTARNPPPRGILPADDGAGEDGAWLPVTTVELDNGLRVHHVRRPFADLVSAGWSVRAGGADDPEGRSGTAHLLEHLLFQGTQTIGSRDWERERELLEREAVLAAADDPDAQALARVRRRLLELQRPGELARLWADGDIAVSGALTTKDFSLYTASFPSQRLEGWMRIEAERILRPALRGVEREKEVVLEENLQRVDSESRGDAEIAFDRFFWGGSPYAEPTDDAQQIRRLHRGDALRFHRRYYRPETVALAVVGDVESEHVIELARRILGGWKEPSAVEARDTEWAAAPAGPELVRSCDCRPSVRVRFPTVAYGHSDAVALDVLAAVLNGRSGRLHRGLVAGSEGAFAAYATHKAQARAGSFTLVAEAQTAGAGEAELRRLLGGLERELAALNDPEAGLRPAELERARHVLLAEAAREAKDSGALRTRLLVDDALGDPGRLRTWRNRLEGVDLADLRRVVSRLLQRERGVVFLLEGEGESRSGGGP